jgi:uncharacterized membrane protein YedE/YeeE
MIDWTHFTPWRSLAGGLLIGLAALLLYRGNGRLAGVSGILGGALEGARPLGWRLAFLLGLALAPALVLPFVPAVGSAPASPAAWVVVAGGLLVGYGSRLANGCTSGHGVCGLARLSGRSLVAVLTFMGSGVATVFLVRHGWGG